MIQSQRGIDTVMLSPQGITDGATVTANLDCRGADYATLRLPFAAEESTHAADTTVSLLESDDTVVTNFATITADVALDLTNAKELRYEVDLLARKRYLRLSVTAGTVTGGNITCAAVATLSRNDESPGSTTEMQAAGTTDSVVVV